jgi:hypothetical protein
MGADINISLFNPSGKIKEAFSIRKASFIFYSKAPLPQFPG